ncbi:MAG TPA: YegS/Rv2252/BmrU family lipid kinase [Verrucomicrobiae bacterium]|nr:YegS/Rv2252/BmrU family lipid kinase [Verrucomicrobiae bacterium]
MLAQLVINLRSGHARTYADATREALRAAGIDVVETSQPSEVVAKADCIVCAGGDGTLLGAIGAAIARDLPLGIVPLGTFNDLARSLGIPLDVRGAVQTIAARHERTIDAASVNGTYYVNEASIGVSSRITRLQTPELKQRFGFLGVIATTFTALRYARPIRAEVRFNGRHQRMRTIQLTVANNRHFGGFIDVEGASIDDGELSLYSVDIRSIYEAFRLALAMVSGRPCDVPGLRVLRARRFEVVTRRRHHIAADGEPAGSTPATFEVLPKALRVFAPQ